MAYVNFVKSKTQTDSLEESKTAPGKIYFPNDNKNGLILAEEIYGVKSNNPNTEFWFGTMAEYSAIVPHNPSTMYCIYDAGIDNNGYEYVDLDLPSGLKWATCNVGATSETENGKWFQWGDTVGYTNILDVDEINTPFYKDGEYNEPYMLSILDTVCPGYILAPEYDTAHVNMGGSWRMPTKEECEELIEHTDSTWFSNYNGATGRKFFSKINPDKYIFIPAAGCAKKSKGMQAGNISMWSSTLREDYLACPWKLSSGSMSLAMNNSYGQDWGNSVRGVLD